MTEPTPTQRVEAAEWITVTGAQVVNADFARELARELEALQKDHIETHQKLASSESEWSGELHRREADWDEERDELRATLASAQERAEDESDELWLRIIAKRWKEATGNLWDDKDAETRGEGIEANLNVLFEKLAVTERNLAEERELCRELRSELLKAERERDGNRKVAERRLTELDIALRERDEAITRGIENHRVAQENMFRAYAAEKERDENYKRIEGLIEKVESLSPHGVCACKLDAPNDLCAHHSPQLAAALRERDESETRKKAMDIAYCESEKDLAAALAENAALRETMQKIVAGLPFSDTRQIIRGLQKLAADALSTPHPGADL